MNGWEMKPLGEDRLLLGVHPGFACGKKDIADGVPHLRMNNISKDGLLEMALIRRIPREIAETQNRFAEAGDILFNNTNSTELVGKSCIFTGWLERCTFSNHLTRLRPNPEKLCAEWLFMCLRDLWLQGYFAANCIEFVGQSAFNKDKLLDVKIPVPPLAEQRRLVCRIKTLTGRLEQARQARQAAIAETQTILRSTRRAAYEAMLDAHESIPLAEVGDVLSGGTPSKAKPEFWGGEIPWVAPKEMKVFRITGSSLHITQQAIDAGTAKLVSEPAVLMVVRGMILARAVPVAIATRPLTINQDMKSFIPRNGHDVAFLAHMLAGAEDELLRRVEVAGHGTCKLESEAWGSLPVPLPPQPIQMVVVRKLDNWAVKVDELRRLQREVESELAAFVPALLAKAFRGEL